MKRKIRAFVATVGLLIALFAVTPALAQKGAVRSVVVIKRWRSLRVLKPKRLGVVRRSRPRHDQ